MNRFCRADVLRILHITAKQLSGWQRAGLAPVTEYFFFSTISFNSRKSETCAPSGCDPRSFANRSRPCSCQVAGMENPLLEASVFNVGGRVAFRHSGHAVEPVAGQYVMDFGAGGTVVPAASSSGKVKLIAQTDSVNELFTRGVSLEEHPGNHDEAIKIYLHVLEIDPSHAAAHINLGTLYYNRQEFGSGQDALSAGGGRRPALRVGILRLG